MKLKSARVIALCGVIAANSAASAAVSVTVDPAAPWNGFMNVFELPANGGGFAFSSGWGTADLVATFSGSTLTLSPTPVNPPAGLGDAFWYNPDGSGNKSMQANMYVQETGTYAGETVVFEGIVTGVSWTPSHATRAFIKDFAPDFSSAVETYFDLDSTGSFSLSLETINDDGRHVQFGFETTGVNVWIDNVAPFGSIQITAIPEPSTGLLAALAPGFLLLRRRRK